MSALKRARSAIQITSCITSDDRSRKSSRVEIAAYAALRAGSGIVGNGGIGDDQRRCMFHEKCAAERSAVIRGDSGINHVDRSIIASNAAAIGVPRVSADRGIEDIQRLFPFENAAPTIAPGIARESRTRNREDIRIYTHRSIDRTAK